jgi:uncharacterized protein (TIGR00251 family)
MLLTVKVSPGAPKTAIKRYENGILYVAVAAAPEKGEANAALIRFLAKELGVAAGEINVVTGAAGRMKRVKLPLTEEVLSRHFEISK